ncbi:MAG: caspase family protein, partial [Methylococcales bacterium]|nr:caspase family protein [Methylococcales bacterium]
MKSLKFLVLISLLLMLPKAQAKIALLIGNDAYTGNPIPALDKAVSDAKRLKNKLIGLGFTVIFKTDLNTEEMRNAIIEFHDALKKNNEVGLFYYAGHGMQVNGDNFLIPVKSNITREFQAKKNAINADEVLEAMFSANTKINLMILDACRDNPISNRGGSRGLAGISREGTFIAYATQPSKTAEDGTFMDYLSKRIMEPLPIDQMFKKVINDVRNKTQGAQVPSYNYNLRNDFYFNGKPKITPSIAVIEAPKVAIVKSDNSWKTIKHYQVKEGLVKDTKTGLMWMRCSLG